ncbi:Speckle-type POZ protein A-like protein [Aphelenchoides besseyi]|nr:Speckle-type POZ protein A-like protein [Aphelenchoides besseyi]
MCLMGSMVLNLHCFSTRKRAKKTCGLYLKIVEKANQLVVRSHYELWIKNKNNQRLYKLASYNHFHGGDLRGWSSYTSRKKLLELAAEDSIVICCNLHPVIDHQLSGNGSSYFSEFARSFDIDRFSDTQFHVNHRIYKVSKAVICAKSSVFQAMFTLSTKEKRTGIVQIMGIETKLIEMLLKFIYTGEVENLKNVAGDLLFVADCYDVKLLVEKCIGSLVENLSIDNVVSVLKYSFFLEHVKNFKSRVLKFAYDHGAELVHLPEWNKLKLEHPIIAVELLQLAFV